MLKYTHSMNWLKLFTYRPIIVFIDPRIRVRLDKFIYLSMYSLIHFKHKRYLQEIMSCADQFRLVTLNTRQTADANAARYCSASWTEGGREGWFRNYPIVSARRV